MCVQYSNFQKDRSKFNAKRKRKNWKPGILYQSFKKWKTIPWWIRFTVVTSKVLIEMSISSFQPVKSLSKHAMIPKYQNHEWYVLYSFLYFFGLFSSYSLFFLYSYYRNNKYDIEFSGKIQWIMRFEYLVDIRNCSVEVYWSQWK